MRICGGNAVQKLRSKAFSFQDPIFVLWVLSCYCHRGFFAATAGSAANLLCAYVLKNDW